MQRFYLDKKIKEGELIEMPKDVAHQIHSVLRMKAGDEIILFDGSGFDFFAEIKSINKKGTGVLIKKKEKNNKEPKNKLILFQSLIKKDKTEWVFEKCTELGVAEIVPVLAARSVKKDFNRSRTDKIIKEAAEQSGRAILPKLHDIMDVDEALNFAGKKCEKVFFAHTMFQGETLDNSPSKTSLCMGLFIGPEGGWTDEEIKKARDAGLGIISLGKTTLRSETAAITGAYVILNGDMFK